MSIIYIDNNHTIKLVGLTNCLTGAIDNGATVTVTLIDSSGTQVTGQSWPATMSIVSESPLTGTYRASLDADLSLVANRSYIAVINATGSGGQIAHWEYPFKAQVRSR